MDLWIRSQDGERLTLCCDFRIYYDNDAGMWAIDACDILGYYISKKRALEVLDGIQDFIKQPTQYESRISYMNGTDMFTRRIYQMPKE